jgi:hypothetical protein
MQSIDSIAPRRGQLVRPVGEGGPPTRVLRLADTIAAYWGSQGLEIKVTVERVLARDGPVWTIRSDLLNGLPRQSFPRKRRDG